MACIRLCDIFLARNRAQLLYTYLYYSSLARLVFRTLIWTQPELSVLEETKKMFFRGDILLARTFFVKNIQPNKIIFSHASSAWPKCSALKVQGPRVWQNLTVNVQKTSLQFWKSHFRTKSQPFELSDYENWDAIFAICSWKTTEWSECSASTSSYVSLLFNELSMVWSTSNGNFQESGHLLIRSDNRAIQNKTKIRQHRTHATPKSQLP